MQIAIRTFGLRKYTFQWALDEFWDFQLLKHKSGSLRIFSDADNDSNISFEKIRFPQGTRTVLTVLVIKTSK